MGSWDQAGELSHRGDYFASGTGLSERGFGGNSRMGWDCWPGAGLGLGEPEWDARGRHKACPYGGGLGDGGGDARTTRGLAFVFVTVDRPGGCVENALIP